MSVLMVVKRRASQQYGSAALVRECEISRSLRMAAPARRGRAWRADAPVASFSLVGMSDLVQNFLAFVEG